MADKLLETQAATCWFCGRNRLDTVAFILLLLAALVSPTQWGLGGNDKAAIPSLTLFDGLIALAFIAFALNTLITGQWKSIRLPAAPLIALLILGGLSILVAEFRKDAIKEWLQWVEIFGVSFMVLVNVARDPRRFLLVLAALGMGTIIGIIIGASQYFQPETSVPALDVRGAFGNRNTYSAYLAIVLPMMWAGALWSKHAVLRIILGLAAALGLLTMLSGGAVLAALIGILLVSALKSRKWLVGTLAAVTAVVMIANLPGALPNKLREAWPRAHFTELDESLAFLAVDPTHNNAPIPNPRYLEWEVIKKSFQFDPQSSMSSDEQRRTLTRRILLGVGIGNYQRNVTPHYRTLERYNFEKPNYNFTEPDTNNQYAVIAFSVGVPALAALVWLMIEAGVLAIRKAIPSDTPALRSVFMGACGGLASLAIVSLFTVPLVRGIHFAIMVLVASAYILENSRKDKSSCSEN